MLLAKKMLISSFVLLLLAHACAAKQQQTKLLTSENGGSRDKAERKFNEETPGVSSFSDSVNSCWFWFLKILGALLVLGAIGTTIGMFAGFPEGGLLSSWFLFFGVFLGVFFLCFEGSYLAFSATRKEKALEDQTMTKRVSNNTFYGWHGAFFLLCVVMAIIVAFSMTTSDLSAARWVAGIGIPALFLAGGILSNCFFNRLKELAVKPEPDQQVMAAPSQGVLGSPAPAGHANVWGDGGVSQGGDTCWDNTNPMPPAGFHQPDANAGGANPFTNDQGAYSGRRRLRRSVQRLHELSCSVSEK